MKPAVNDETPVHVTRKRVTFDSTPCSRKHVVSQQNENAAKDGNGNDHHDDAPNCCNCRCHYYYYHHDGFSNDERKSLCWYSPEDLLPCREDAKNAIQQLQTSLENGTLDNLPEHICLRGIEKYADAATRYRKQRIFIDSILQQQQQQQQQQQAMMNQHPQRSTSSCGTAEDLANLARYLSKPSIELALFYAGRCAAELALLRHEEEDEEEDEDEWEDEEEDFSCSSQMDARESKLDVQEQEQKQQQQEQQQQQDVCVDRKRKRSRFLALGDMNSMPPRKVQCCE